MLISLIRLTYVLIVTPMARMTAALTFDFRILQRLLIGFFVLDCRSFWADLIGDAEMVRFISTNIVW